MQEFIIKINCDGQAIQEENDLPRILRKIATDLDNGDYDYNDKHKLYDNNWNPVGTAEYTDE